MDIEFVTSQCYKSHELALAYLLWGTVAQVSDVAHGPLVHLIMYADIFVQDLFKILYHV